MQENEKLLKESIKRMVRESIFDLINGGISEKKKENEKDKSSHKKKRRNTKEIESSNKRRKRVIQYLKDEKTDIAPYAYELWPEKEEASARSYFYKCLDNKTIDGITYSFSDEEINTLHSMITDRKAKIS